VRDNFVGVDGLGLKIVASRGAGFHWRDEEPGGLNSQSWFNEAIDGATDDARAAARTRVLDYNEDDVRATLAVRRWLTTQDESS
jgi:predicted RecB family nuclease